jgi:PKD repeat protein
MVKLWKRAAEAIALCVLVAVSGCSGGSSGSGKTTTNNPPVAVAGGPYSGAPGTAITFTGTGSTDPQGQALTYAWNFGDGSTGSGAQTQHTYAKAGAFTVTLTVTDTSGLSGSQFVPANIGAAPVANTGGPYTAYIYVPITFNGSGSSDPEGEALTYQWNFGDDTTGTGVAPVHTYSNAAGTFTVTLKVTNTSGFANTASTTLTLKNPPPTVIINGPYTGKPTLAISFTSRVTDPIDDDWTYAWSFGDGGTSNVANPTHTYASAGTYPVSLFVLGQYNDATTVTSTATIVAEGAGPALNGVVQSGNVPISGAHVYLFAANTTGYGQGSLSLLSNTGNSDANGSYVLSNGSGSFTLPAGYSCPTHSQVYVYTSGGTIGANTNTSAGLLSALGACGYLNSSSAITVNEATTVAAAYAMSGYATGAAQVSSPNTTAALTGIGNAFLNAANLVSSASGNALATTPVGNGTVPQATINTLASILNACASATPGASECTTLFANSKSTGSTGTVPTDTASAAINIAHNQGANVAALYALQPSPAAFTPTLATQPHDWTLGVSYTGVDQTIGLAIDGAGDVWVLQYPQLYNSYPYLTELASNGDVLQSENTTCSVGGEPLPAGITVDTAGNVWLLATSGQTYTDTDGNEYSYYVSQFCTVSSTGAMLSPPGGYPLGGSETSNLTLYSLANDGKGNAWIPSTTLLERALNGNSLNGNGYIIGNSPMGLGVAIDASGDFWMTATNTNGIIELGSTGQVLSPLNGYIGGGLSTPGPIALDHSGNVWAINTTAGYLYAGTSLSELSSTGAALSPSSGFTNGALTNPYALAIDGAGNVWIANGSSAVQTVDNSVVELAPAGAQAMYIAHQNSPRGYLDLPQSIAVDSTGAVWLSDGDTNTVTQFVGVATPVVTPLAANLNAPYNAPASKP